MNDKLFLEVLVGFNLLVGCIALYGAAMGMINYKIHLALKDYLVAKGLGETEEM